MKLVEMHSAEADFTSSTPIVALVPIGAVEQHSRHLPVGTDALIVEMIAADVEHSCPADILLLPAVYIGASDHHLSMAGTVSVGTRSLAEALAAQCLSLHRSSGIQAFFILNGHGGNQPAARLTLELLACSGAPVVGFAADYWTLMFDEMDRRGVARPRGMGHADVVETSILLARRPELVRMEFALPDAYLDDLGGVYTSLGIPHRTTSGGVGDPTGATPQAGEQFMDAATRGVTRAVVQAADISRRRCEVVR